MKNVAAMKNCGVERGLVQGRENTGPQLGFTRVCIETRCLQTKQSMALHWKCVSTRKYRDDWEKDFLTFTQMHILQIIRYVILLKYMQLYYTWKSKKCANNKDKKFIRW